MALTPVQERTLVDVMASRAARPVFERGLADALREELEGRLAPAVERLAPDRTLWITKARLVDLHVRCEGAYLANELGESLFEYGRELAIGRLVHKGVEISVHARELAEAELVERATARLLDADQAFADFLGLLDAGERSELVGEAVRQLAWFRAAFPPFEPAWNPVVEWPIRVELLGGRVVLSTRPDVVLGGMDPDEPMRARRLVLELKGGQERPEQDEDVRFYALVQALALGVPPFRVATVYLQSGRTRPQDVTVDLLRGAVRRVADACVRAAALLGGEEPRLRPGAWCSWCPRSETCPASATRKGDPAGE